MAITFAALQSYTSNTDATSYASASYTPTASRLLVAFILTTYTTPVAPTTVTGNNVTWYKKTSINSGSVANLSVWVALSGTGSTATGLTADYGAVTQTGQLMSIYEVAGAYMPEVPHVYPAASISYMGYPPSGR